MLSPDQIKAIGHLVDGFPPLTAEQRVRLSAILRAETPAARTADVAT